MSENNGFAVCTLEHGCYDIALIEGIVGKVIVLALILLNPFVKTSGFACH